MRIPGLALCGFILMLSGCSDYTPPEDVRATTVTLPGGQKIKAEMKINQQDVLAGMRFRDSLPSGRGMLFIFAQEGGYGFWMYQVKVPLDIVWMNRDRMVVEIVEKAPPCPGPPDKCVNYGGKVPAMYVLELPGGDVRKYNLKVGDRLDF